MVMRWEVVFLGDHVVEGLRVLDFWIWEGV